MNLSDESARQAALDMRYSVIVQSPAGSGKTELLCQRFLAALVTSEQPEQVLAITFTRKAANEMRERILRYLQDGSHPFAKKVLEKDQEKNWKILLHPERLSIMTIDSLCARIVEKAPISSTIYGYNITEMPMELYREAAIAMLEDVDQKHEWQAALHALLLQCDNHWRKLQTLLIDMLAKREQWLMLLPEIYDLKEWRLKLEKNLAECAKEALLAVQKRMPQYLKAELEALMEFVCLIRGDTPIVKLETFWQQLPSFVLTQTGELRKTVDKRCGFPLGEGDQKKIFKIQKQKMLRALEELSNIPGMPEALQNLSRAPTTTYTDKQWQRVVIILQVLRALLAYWQVTIQQKKEIDFTEIALKALMVLGKEDEPTELALTLDYRLQHILVDEFQDTSLLQYRLLERLTQTWEADCARTLFLVGDPLQSIYRFRQAEVGLFLRVWEQGFSHLKLMPIQLTQNFRSQKPLIDFYNEKLVQILPKVSVMQEGAVAYVPVMAAATSSMDSRFHENDDKFCRVWSEKSDERLVIHLKKLHQENSSAKIAILVRSRTHLQNILPKLHAEKLEYQARDLTTLAEQPVVIDLLSWLKALLNLEDRLAWLSVLNAPWCSLSMPLLQSLFEKENHLVWQRLLDWKKDPLHDENTDLQKCITLWEEALTNLQQQPLDQLLYSLWNASGAQEYWADEISCQAEKQFWRLLQKHQQAGDLPSLQQFERYLHHASFLPKEKNAWLEIMTIHKAKGLEFDFVFLPALEKVGQHDDHPLLVFDEIVLSSGPTFLLAPFREKGEEDSIFEFIWQLQKTKASHERLRLLYVACTRAKQGLYFYSDFDIEKENPRQGSFLADLLPALN